MAHTHTTIEKDAILTIKGLKKSYAGGKKHAPVEALKGIDLEIPRGSIFGLLGPNGAGKSTIINILAGLTVKTKGTLVVNGIDQDVDARATRQEMGIVPQETLFDPFFSIHETLEYHAGYYGIPKGKRKTKQILKDLSLSDKAHTTSRKLSGGMKRRLLVAKALVHSPPILILDEPTAGVDVELRTQLWDYVRKLNDNGTTILLTTHYLEEAEALCDNIAIINHGQIIANGTMAELKSTLTEKELTISFKETIKKVPDSLKRYKAKKLGDSAITIGYNKADVSLNEILEALCDEKLTIRDISTDEADLEDVFRHLVKKQNAENVA